jgi:putative tryptophan/tyrosine transport system substrate-binding protein
VRLNHRVTQFGLFALLLSISVPANGQQQPKVSKIGWLGSRSADSPDGGRRLFLRNLAELGYVEGKNIVFEYRSAHNKMERVSGVADELVRLKVDVLVTAATAATIAAKNATRTIPIVFLSSGDPVPLGLVDSLARPGGNMTGFTNIAPVLAGKRLELLKETVPNLSRVAVLWDPKNEGNLQLWKESQLAALE